MNFLSPITQMNRFLYYALICLSFVSFVCCKNHEIKTVELEEPIKVIISDCLKGRIGFFIPPPKDTMGNTDIINSFTIFMDTFYSMKYTNQSDTRLDQYLPSNYQSSTLQATIKPMRTLPDTTLFEKRVTFKYLSYDAENGIIEDWIEGVVEKVRYSVVFIYAKPLRLSTIKSDFIAFPVMFISGPKTAFEAIFVLDPLNDYEIAEVIEVH